MGRLHRGFLCCACFNQVRSLGRRGCGRRKPDNATTARPTSGPSPSPLVARHQPQNSRAGSRRMFCARSNDVQYERTRLRLMFAAARGGVGAWPCKRAFSGCVVRKQTCFAQVVGHNKSPSICTEFGLRRWKRAHQAEYICWENFRLLGGAPHT